MTASEHFWAEFQKWEQRGRGWQLYEQPVAPEPPFIPFQPRSMADLPVKDSAVRDSFMGSLFNKFLAPPKSVEPDVEPEEESEPNWLERSSLVELQVTLPADLDIAQASLEQLFTNLSLCREPVAFELLGTPKRVLAQFVAGEADATLVRKQLAAYFPNVSFHERTDTLARAWENSDGEEIFAVDFGLEREFMLPLASGKLDPFIGIVSALAGLQAGELALFQVLWQPIHRAWADSIVRSVTTSDGKPLFINRPELTRAAETKVAKPLYAAVVRMVIRASTTHRLHTIAREIASSLRAFAHPHGNALIPLEDDYDHYPPEEHVLDALFRQTRRSGMILSSDELFSFVHLPTEAVRTPELTRDLGRTRAAPATRSPGLLIGDNEHQDETVSVFLTPDQRVRHTHIIGIPGTGKSSLLFNLIRQDIDNHQGVAVLDPHGDLIENILGIIPDDRIDEVVLVDLSDTEFPVGFNILQAHSPAEKLLLASDLVAVLHRFSTSWGDNMEVILQNAILTFLDSSSGGTLEDLSRLLSETPYRNQFLKTVANPRLLYFWENTFPKFGGNKSAGSVVMRLENFFSRDALRNMLSQPDSKLNFADIMNGGKILLVKLPEGLNGKENVHLLGSLIVAKLQQTALARQSQTQADRKDFWLYVDEFDHFVSPSMATILTEARKYRLGLTLAHQQLHQLQSDPSVASAVNSSVCTRIVLRVGDDDAKKLADSFASFDAKTLKNLENYSAIARIERPDGDFNLTLRPPDLTDYSDARKAEVIAESRVKYATLRVKVEADWLANLNRKVAPPPPTIAERPKVDETTVPVSPTSQPEPVIAEAPHVAELPKATELPVARPPLANIENQPPTVTKPLLVVPIDRSAGQNVTVEPRMAGRGLVVHKTMQQQLKLAAQKLGFWADSEKQLDEGSKTSKVADVVLQQADIIIAVEFALTPNLNHEFENVQKCLLAGFQRVAVITIDEKFLAKLAAAVRSGMASDAAAKVNFYYTTEAFLQELKKLAATIPPPSDTTGKTVWVGGVEVTVNFPTDHEKQSATHTVVAKSLKP